MSPKSVRQIDGKASASDKISLFRSYFRGREEVYARRFEGRKTGKAGYAPVCGHEWMRGLCDKPKVKCSDCPHRSLLPMTDEVIRWHLSGQDGQGKDFVAGVYPMLLDESCHFLAADFDKASWAEDVIAVLTTCRQLGLPAAIERSRSGKGAHLWLFFAEPIPACLARKLGTHLLTETMERRPDLGLDSYDRLFPNQDTLPHGGFGNLIALPLQRKARSAGNSVFVDDSLKTIEDQWAFLSAMRKIERQEVESLVAAAETKGRIVGVRLCLAEEDEGTAPWRLPVSRRRPLEPLLGIPEQLEVVLGNQLYVAAETLSPGLRNRLIRLAAFQNPEFYKAQAMRFSTHDIPRIISCAEIFPKHIGLPRGCLDELRQLAKNLDIKMDLRDERATGQPLTVAFRGQLRPEQQAVAEALLADDFGVLSATTAFGKTVIGAWLIAQRRTRTLILVHRRQLQAQWMERLDSFLDLPSKSIGQIGGGRKKPTGIVDVALIQSLARKGEVEDLVGEYGHLIVDECHHVPAQSFEQIMRQAKAKYVTGLTATVTRKDGHHPIVMMQCGPIRARVNAKAQAAARPFEHTVWIRPTSFFLPPSVQTQEVFRFHALYEALIRDEKRNRLICDDIAAVVANGRSPMVLTERNEHLDLLAERLSGIAPHLVVLRGGMRAKEIAQLPQRLASIPENEGRILLATGGFVGEGFDDARLDTLFLTLPISWRGTLAQYVGRLHRFHDRKKEVVVYDYADLNVPMLERMFNRRCRGYEAVGYKLLIPASAVPGWPLDVPLPVDPQWKTDYAASVHRLIRDGVSLPLARLFVKAASHPLEEAEGVQRARSAGEAFLFSRLETLPQTAGRFRLNEPLSIPFDGLGQMEVDLLCADARIAVELDGDQHLADVNAYRCDRRKDALLQQNGYLVLRFLCEDVAKHLDEVLDTLLRALIRQAQKG